MLKPTNLTISTEKALLLNIAFQPVFFNFGVDSYAYKHSSPLIFQLKTSKNNR